jgi:hypothetical protein
MSGSHRRHTPQTPVPAPRTIRTARTGGSLRRRMLVSVVVATVGTVALGVTYVSAHPNRRAAAPAALLKSGEMALWGPAAAPGMAGDVDSRAVELGTRFSTSTPGSVTGILFYRYADSGAPDTGTLWDAAGRRLASVAFPAATGAGWQLATLQTPVTLAAGTGYVVSYHAEPGRYADDTEYFGRGRAHRSGPLTATAGVYAYGDKSAFPTQTWRDSSYFVDVAFRPQAGAPLPPAPQPPKPTTTAPKPPPTTPKPPTAPPTTTTPPPVPPAPPTPPMTGFPNASNTGVPAGTPLTIVNGGVTLTGSNTALDARDIRGDLNIRGTNIKVTRTIVRGHVFVNGSLVMEDSEIRPRLGVDFEVSDYQPIQAGNYTLRRVHVHGYQDGPRTGLGTTLIEDSLLDNLAYGPGEHMDAYQQYGPGVKTNVTLRHNTISGKAGNANILGNAAVFWSDHPGRGSTFVLDGNLLSGGAFTIRVNDTNAGSGVVADIKNNIVVANSYQYGPAETNLSTPFNGTDGVKWTNNKLDNGKVISGP